MIETRFQTNVTSEERKIARNWYFWLWLSPLLTIPTLIIVFFISANWSYRFASELLCFLFAVLGSALWHLILLIPIYDDDRFIRWHGFQALSLALIRTAIPLFAGLISDLDTGTLLAIPFLLVVWFFGTLWGQLEANRGKCTLMERFGSKEKQPLEPTRGDICSPEETNIQAWMETIRFSADPQDRAQALQALEQLGMTEQL